MTLVQQFLVFMAVAGSYLFVSPDAHAQAFQTLYRFPGGADGAVPTAGLIYGDGKLYGVTQAGGATPCRCGLVFSMDPTTGAETKLHALDGDMEGGEPSQLAYANGYLFGTAYDGGTYGFGTLFKVDASTGALTVLYNFPGATGGSFPTFGVTPIGSTLYGTTDGEYFEGGKAVDGTVFKFDLQTQKESSVHVFHTVRDAVMPEGLLQDSGLVYGASLYGGNTLCIGQGGCGIIFKIDPATNKETVLHRFKGAHDGANPTGVIKWQGALYGALQSGGGRDCDGYGCGSVFKMDPNTGSKVNIYNFKAHDDFKHPGYDLVYHDGAVYGTADIDYFGASCGIKSANCGGIFKVNLSTGTETVLYRFTGGADGGEPEGNLLYHDGALYGTTFQGGDLSKCNHIGCGTVFKLTLAR